MPHRLRDREPMLARFGPEAVLHHRRLPPLQPGEDRRQRHQEAQDHEERSSTSAATIVETQAAVGHVRIGLVARQPRELAKRSWTGRSARPQSASFMNGHLLLGLGEHRLGLGEVHRRAQLAGQVRQDLPAGQRVAGGRDGGADALDHAQLVGERAVDSRPTPPAAAPPGRRRPPRRGACRRPPAPAAGRAAARDGRRRPSLLPARRRSPTTSSAVTAPDLRSLARSSSAAQPPAADRRARRRCSGSCRR